MGASLLLYIQLVLLLMLIRELFVDIINTIYTSPCIRPDVTPPVNNRRRKREYYRVRDEGQLGLRGTLVYLYSRSVSEAQ